MDAYEGRRANRLADTEGPESYTKQRREGEIVQEGGRLHQSISEVDDTVTQLLARLELILKPDNPAPIAPTDDAPEASQLAYTLRDETARLDRINAILISLLYRIDL